MITTRAAQPNDADGITTIYNQGIADRVATFETKPRTAADVRAWFNLPYPVVVAERDGVVVAFANATAHSPRPCYAGIVNFSVYVERTARRHGVGRATVQALIDAAEAAKFTKIVSRVFVENAASRHLLHTLGFREVGTHYSHARLDGVWRDVVVVERLLEANL